MTQIPTIVGYDTDGKKFAWHIPFRFARPSDVAVKLVDEAGLERRLTLGQDYQVENYRGFPSVIYVAPAGQSIRIWLDAEETGSWPGQPPFAGPDCGFGGPGGGFGGPGNPAVLAALEKRLAQLEEDQRAALEAARRAEADAQLKAIREEGDNARAELGRAIAEEADAAAGKIRACADGALASLDGLGAQGLGHAAAAREARGGAEAARDLAGESAAAAQAGARQAGESAEAARGFAGDAANAAGQARAAGEELAASLAGAEASARASANSAAAAHEQNLCAWRGAFQASLAMRQPGIACVKSLGQMEHALPGYYFVDEEMRQGPSHFMGLYAVRELEDMAWDAFFFLDEPWPDYGPDYGPDCGPGCNPGCQPGCPGCKPGMPGGSGGSGGSDGSDGSGDAAHWLPCEHGHC